MSKQPENGLPFEESDVRLTESALDPDCETELDALQNPSSSSSVLSTQPGEPEAPWTNSPVDGRDGHLSADNFFAASTNPDDEDSVQEVTWVVSKLDIFKSTSSSQRKSEEITDFYKMKLYKSGVMLKKPLQIYHRENPADGGFRVLMKAPGRPVPSETRLVGVESLHHSSSTSSSRSEILDNKKSDKSIRNEVSESKKETSESKKEPSGLFSVFSNLLGNWRNRNQPRLSRSCLLGDSECEPLRRCHKAIDVRKPIPQ